MNKITNPGPITFTWITADILRETAGAFLLRVKMKEATDNIEVWLPKSHTEIWKLSEGEGIRIPYWLFTDRNLHNAIEPTRTGYMEALFCAGRWQKEKTSCISLV